MALVKKERKTYFLRKKRQVKAPKTLTKRGKLPSKPKRNICIIRFPRSSYLTTCPLVSWYFNRRMRNDVLSLHKCKDSMSPCMAYAHKMSLRLDQLRKQPPFSRIGAESLRKTLREVAKKKRAKWVVEPTKKRRRYSDNEIFYRLANSPSKPEETEDSTFAAGVEDMTHHAPGVLQPTASQLQEALS